MFQDDLKALVAGMKKQLQEAQEAHGKQDNKLTSAVTSLRQLQEEKSELEARLGQKQATLQAQVGHDSRQYVGENSLLIKDNLDHPTNMGLDSGWIIKYYGLQRLPTQIAINN